MQCIAMRTLVLGLGLAGAILLASQPLRPALSQSGEGWVTLVDGKTLGDWDKVGPEANWRIEDGALVADKKTGTGDGASYLLTKQKYKDHMIYAEFWASDDANSGIFVRCNNTTRIGARTATR